MFSVNLKQIYNSIVNFLDNGPSSLRAFNFICFLFKGGFIRQNEPIVSFFQRFFSEEEEQEKGDSVRDGEQQSQPSTQQPQERENASDAERNDKIDETMQFQSRNIFARLVLVLIYTQSQKECLVTEVLLFLQVVCLDYFS